MGIFKNRHKRGFLTIKAILVFSIVVVIWLPILMYLSQLQRAQLNEIAARQQYYALEGAINFFAEELNDHKFNSTQEQVRYRININDFDIKLTGECLSLNRSWMLTIELKRPYWEIMYNQIHNYEDDLYKKVLFRKNSQGYWYREIVYY